MDSKDPTSLEGNERRTAISNGSAAIVTELCFRRLPELGLFVFRVHDLTHGYSFHAPWGRKNKTEALWNIPWILQRMSYNKNAMACTKIVGPLELEWQRSRKGDMRGFA